MTTKQKSAHFSPKSFIQPNRSLGLCFVVLFSVNVSAQSTIYSQAFSGTLAGSGWTNTNLTSPWGNASYLGAYPNIWMVDDNESGLASNNCGGALLGDQSLYMGFTLFSSGAAYLSDINTNRRIASPNVSTSGYTNVILEFDFIGNGEGTTDKAYLVYSIDGGTSWIAPTGAPTSASPAMGTGGTLNNLKSQICGSGQGLWTHLTWTMPTTCENITNLRVGFVWQSNNNSAGSDPSFAVDDVKITATLTPAPIELLSFTGRHNGTMNLLEWATATETNNDYFTIERSGDAVNFGILTTVNGSGSAVTINTYQTVDEDPLPGINYYRLKQTDFDGQFTYSDIISISSMQESFEITSAFSQQGILRLTFSESTNGTMQVDIFNIEGKLIRTVRSLLTDASITLPAADLVKGMYIIRASNGISMVTRRIVL